MSSVIVWQRGAWDVRCWIFHLSLQIHVLLFPACSCPTGWAFRAALVGCFAPGSWMESGIGRLWQETGGRMTMRAACLFLQDDPCLCCPPGSNRVYWETFSFGCSNFPGFLVPSLCPFRLSALHIPWLPSLNPSNLVTNPSLNSPSGLLWALHLFPAGTLTETPSF